MKDINPGTSGSFPFELTDSGGILFFEADDGVHGGELWKSDGTDVGTVLVKDINPGAESAFPGWLTEVRKTLFFSAKKDFGAPELYKSDGTEAGTVLVKNDDKPTSLANGHGILFFVAFGQDLSKTDGTKAGTIFLRDNFRSELTDVGRNLYYSGWTSRRHGIELWRTDGTKLGTHLVRDINAGQPSSYPARLTKVGSRLFFWADDGVHGGELWKSDGTDAGTVLVRDIYPGAGSSV